MSPGRLTGEGTPGTHRISWDTRDDRGQNVASGVYFYRMQAGSFTDVKRLTVIR